MADDHFGAKAATITGPALGAFVITPNDSTDLTDPIRQITINASGTVSFVSSRDGQTYTTDTLPVGSYPMFASRIRATGTTATGLTGWV